jgi:hypothetical protein
MAHLREIVLRFDSHESVVDAEHIIRVDVERDIIGDLESGDFTLGPHVVTIVVEAENVTSYARDVTPKPKALTSGQPALPDRPRRLLRRGSIRVGKGRAS